MNVEPIFEAELPVKRWIIFLSGLIYFVKSMEFKPGSELHPVCPIYSGIIAKHKFPPIEVVKKWALYYINSKIH